MKKSFFILFGFIFFFVTLALKTLETWMPTDIRLDTGDTAGTHTSWSPQIACSGNNVYVTWKDNRNGANDIYFNSSADNGTNWQVPDTRLDTGDSPGAENSEDPQISCSGPNVYVTWSDYRNGANDIYFNYSTDNGLNWQASDIRLDTGDTAGLNSSGYPQIACSGNNVYVTWEDFRNGSNDIYFNYSTDNGVNWQALDIRLDTGDSPGAHPSHLPRIACSGMNVYVVWWDNRAADIYFNSSSDGGATWQTPDIRLSTGDPPGAHGSIYPQIACSGTNVYVVWHDARNYWHDVYFNYSTDNGITWQASSIRLDTGDEPGVNNSQYPQIACSGNNVYVVWEDNRNGFYDIHFNYSTNGGINWQTPDIHLDSGDVFGAHNSRYPQISCAGDSVYVTWQDSRNGANDIYFNYSIDHGVQWQAPAIRLDTGDTAGVHDSISPRLGCFGDNVYVVWQDNRSGLNDIYFNSKRAMPWIDIKANGSDSPITITQSDTLRAKVSLVTDGITNNVDFWLLYKGPNGWYHFDFSSKSWNPGLNVTHQGALFDLNNKKVFQSSGLSLGTYRFYFGVDMNMDGKVTKNCLFYDEVMVTVTSN